MKFRKRFTCAMALTATLSAVAIGNEKVGGDKTVITIKKSGAMESDAPLSVVVNDEKLKTLIESVVGKGMEGLNQAIAQIDGKKIELAAGQLNEALASVDVNEIRDTIRRAIEGGNSSHSWSYSSSASESVTRGNPYSSRETREFKQTLGDGTVISRQSTRLLARDGEGRTRQELRQPDGTARIFINDPVAKRAHIIDPQRRAACSAKFDKDAINDCFQQMRGDWKPVGFSFSPSSRGGIPIMPSTEDMQIHVSSNAKVIDLTEGQGRGPMNGFTWSSSTRSPTPPTPPTPPVPPSTPGSRDSKTTRETSSTSYEGLRVDVTRSVETIAVGAMGNNRPIETVFERYYSPELKMTVFSRRSDPRSGEQIYRMVDIKRSEPDASLFRVPSGFSESEGKAKN